MASKISPQVERAECLKDHFLIAMPGLNDSLFSHSVTYICDHNERGAMGIVINHPLNITMDEVFEQLELKYDGPAASIPILAGGPVNFQQGFVLHRNEGDWESTLLVTPEVCLTASKDIVASIAKNHIPSGAQFALGYAGWAPGQLEEEISHNSWLTIPADTSILFDTPVDKRWAAAANYIGVDMNLISSSVGHA